MTFCRRSALTTTVLISNRPCVKHHRWNAIPGPDHLLSNAFMHPFTKRKYMKTTGHLKTVLLLSLLATFPPLSTDMYLPALPFLQKIWQQPMATMNLTLVVFFVTYCLTLVMYGPLSDRFGRRKPLLLGIAIYILASLLCAFSGNVYSLIIFRILQAAGASSASVISMAITKDLYEGYERQRLLGYMGVIMALAPMLAPVLGAWIMTYFSWPWIFICQGAIGFVAWAGVFFMEEPLKELSASGVRATAGMYLQLLHNKSYLGMVVLFSLIVFPHFSFIGSAADIYINTFGTSEQVFGYFFAFNAFSIMAGSFAFTRLHKRIESRKLLTISFAGILLGGLLMRSALFSGPWTLALPMALVSFFFGCSRPPQQQPDSRTSGPWRRNRLLFHDSRLLHDRGIFHVVHCS